MKGEGEREGRLQRGGTVDMTSTFVLAEPPSTGGG